jgi:hypothetical protein
MPEVALENSATKCLWCGKEIPGIPGAVSVCQECLSTRFQCDWCNRVFSQNDSHTDVAGTQLCDDCMNENYLCDRCGCFTTEVDDGLCEDCYDGGNELELRDHGRTPKLNFLNTKEEKKHEN